jgi:hypothetical protein
MTVHCNSSNTDAVCPLHEVNVFTYDLTPAHIFTRTALFPLIPLWACFSLYYFTLHVPLL